MTAPTLHARPGPVDDPTDLSVVLQFTGSEAEALSVQAAAQGIGVGEYARRATVQHLMASWDRPLTRPSAA